jgi:predicted small secreted protein
MRSLVKTAAIVVLILTPMTLSACNTVAGAGQDTKDAGQAVKNAASN